MCAPSHPAEYGVGEAARLGQALGPAGELLGPDLHVSPTPLGRPVGPPASDQRLGVLGDGQRGLAGVAAGLVHHQAGQGGLQSPVIAVPLAQVAAVLLAAVEVLPGVEGQRRRQPQQRQVTAGMAGGQQPALELRLGRVTAIPNIAGTCPITRPSLCSARKAPMSSGRLMPNPPAASATTASRPSGARPSPERGSVEDEAGPPARIGRTAQNLDPFPPIWAQSPTTRSDAYLNSNRGTFGLLSAERATRSRNAPLASDRRGAPQVTDFTVLRQG